MGAGDGAQPAPGGFWALSAGVELLSLKNKMRSLRVTRSLSELLPWMVLLTPDTVVNKDGSLIRVYRFTGQDADGRPEAEAYAASDGLRRALDSLGNGRLMLWWTVLRTRIRGGYPAGEFTNGVAKKLDEIYREGCERQRWYVNHHYLSVLQAPAPTLEQAMARTARDGMSAGARGILRYIREKLSGEAQFDTEVDELVHRLGEHQETASTLIGAMPEVGFRPLQNESLLGFLNATASPATGLHPVSVNPDLMYLDEALGEDALSVLSGRLYFQGAARDAYVAALTIKPMPAAWPESTWPGMLDALADVDSEGVLSVAMRMMDPEKVKEYIRVQRRHHLNWRKGIMGYLKEGVLHVETENVDSSAQILADDADRALADLAFSPSGGWLNVTMVLKSDTEAGLERAVSEASRALQQAGFAPLRERLHLLSVWAGTMPGQWGESVRWVYSSGRAMGDFVPLRTRPAGSIRNQHLSKQAGRPVGALTVFPTRGRTPCYFGPHVGDVGHTLIMGPTGAGKTVLGNFLSLEWDKFPDGRVFVFDKDRSCRILTGLLNGVTLDAATQLRVNPCAGLKTDRDWQWFAGWVSRLLSARGEPLVAGEENEVAEAIAHLRTIGDHRLDALSAILPARLAARLAPWVGSGRWSGFFDHEDDNLDFGVATRIAVEMGAMMRFPEASRAFMDLAFWRIERALTGAPTLIYIEEAWFMLSDEAFARRIEDWLRTLRKLNGTVMMATQSLAELVESHAFTLIAGGVPNRFLLANPDVRAFATVYRDKLGLTDEQIDLIAGLQPKREYLYVSGGRTRVVAPIFAPRLLAALRSDSRAQQIYDRWTLSKEPDWQEGYLQEVSDEQA